MDNKVCQKTKKDIKIAFLFIQLFIIDFKHLFQIDIIDNDIYNIS